MHDACGIKANIYPPVSETEIIVFYSRTCRRAEREIWRGRAPERRGLRVCVYKKRISHSLTQARQSLVGTAPLQATPPRSERRSPRWRS